MRQQALGGTQWVLTTILFIKYFCGLGFNRLDFFLIEYYRTQHFFLQEHIKARTRDKILLLLTTCTDQTLHEITLQIKISANGMDNIIWHFNIVSISINSNEKVYFDATQRIYNYFINLNIISSVETIGRR